MPVAAVLAVLTTPPSVMLELPAAATLPAAPATPLAVPAAPPAEPAVPTVPPAPELAPSLAGISFRSSASSPKGTSAPRAWIDSASDMRARTIKDLTEGRVVPIAWAMSL